MFKRVVIKLSGESLAGNGAGRYDDAVIDGVAGQLKTLLESDAEAALVVGGGNLWRGRQARPDMDCVKADQIGMLATVMNAIYLSEAFKRGGVQSRVFTPLPFGNFTLIYDKETALALMKEKTVCINAAGLGHPYFSTDTVTALRAAELGADAVLYAKHIDGVYDRDPAKYPGARKYKRLSYRTALAGSLNAADMAALHLSNGARIPSFVFNLDEPRGIINACNYPETGPLEGTYLDVDIEEDFYV